MDTRIYRVDEPFRPSPQRNNLWYQDRKTDQVIVFVHGVLSDSCGCWYREQPKNEAGVYWPDLLVKDSRFADYSIYLGGYSTTPTAQKYEVSDCAEELRNALWRPDEKTKRYVMEEKTIIFVCHSMGGVVTRYMLTARPWEFKDKRIGLVLIASPSSGSRWADRLDLLVKYFDNEQGAQLQWGNWTLQDLDGRFRIIVHEKAIPQLFGAEACENQFIFGKKWYRVEPIVTRDSAGVYFNRVRMLANTDHFTCVKPDNREHPAYEFLLDFCNALSADETKKLRPTLTTASGVTQASDVASADDYVCQCLHWDVRIDEEGDAYTDMSYENIMLFPSQRSVFELPPAEVQSGHTTEYELIWDGRTTEGAALERAKATSPTKIQMNVKFANPPTRKNPAGFAVRCWDWNVYSMNMEEYRQKPGWREDGLDYAEKYIPQQWKRFTMVIEFPQEIVFAKRPFFEIYTPGSDPDQVRSEEHTTTYQHCFYYSAGMNLAFLMVERPPWPFCYRISWLLGESGVSREAALMPLERHRQHSFGRKLLSMRRALDGDPKGDVDEARRLEVEVNSALASFAQFVKQTLGNVELEAANFEISLMVLDEDRPEQPPFGSRKLPVLRIVAGTVLQDPVLRAFFLFIGDGNAGRAWKRRMARIYDRNEKDPKRHIYIPISDSTPHRFLVSIPLIDKKSEALLYGILNVGTFSEEQAEMLRPMAAPEQIETLTSWAQSYVLKRLLEVLKMELWH